MLQRRGGGEGHELVRRPDPRRQMRRRDRPADLPARERERLAQRRKGHRALPHAGERGQPHVLALEDEPLVDLVGDGDRVVLAAQVGDQLQLGAP